MFFAANQLLAQEYSPQGVRWESGTLQQALDLVVRAGAQISTSSAGKNQELLKMVFLDCYTQTCPPCKMMLAKIFPTKQAGDYFNSRFINVKLDLSAPENTWIAEKYDVSTFPTLLFLSPDGSELCRIVGASATPEELIGRVEHILDPANRVEALVANFNSTGNSEYLFKYLQRLQKEGQYRKLREYVINNYDELSFKADPGFWKYIKIAINLQNLSVLEKVLADKAKFHKSLGKERFEKDIYNDLKYELNLYNRKGGNYPAANIGRAQEIMQMFSPVKE